MRLRSLLWLAGVFIAVAFLADPVFASTMGEGEPAPAWLRFIGRFHPLLVHFPIALILTAAALEGWQFLRDREECSSTALVLIRLGALSALAAGAAGWILADSKSFGRAVESTIFYHRWLGVSAFGFAVLASIAGAAAKRGLGTRLYRFVLIGAFFCASGAGHLGGELVYGDGYLFAVFAEREVAPVVSDEGSIYSLKIAPILEEHCYSCHGEKKQKGKLRLDSKAEAFKGDRATWLIIAGNAEESELIKRVSLPADDFDIMPAKGDPLSAEQVAELRAWVDAGAEWPE